MGLLEKLKSRTIKETIDSVKESVTEAAKNGMDEKLEGALRVLPLVAAFYLIFGSDSRPKQKKYQDPQQIVIINNYGDEAVRQHYAQDDS